MVQLGSGSYAAVDLLISQGADCTYAFQYLTQTGGPGVDMTGWTGSAQIRAYRGGPIWASFTTGTGITLDSAGNVILTIPHTLTTGPEWDGYFTGVWDLVLTDTAGSIVRLVEGTVTIDHSVTR